jgi:ribonuclease HI
MDILGRTLRCVRVFRKLTHAWESIGFVRGWMCIDRGALRNGQPDASGGIGVYVAPNHPMNRAEPLTGKCTNQRAEIMSAIRALEKAVKNTRGKVVYGITLVSDSVYLIKMLSQWLWRWRENGYRKTNGEPVKNMDLILRVDEAAGAYKALFIRDNPNCRRNDAVQLRHVYGHSGDHGNEQADAFARKGALRYGKMHFGH